jgi:hypothetical protein
VRRAINGVLSSAILLALVPPALAKEDPDREFHKLFDGRVAETQVRCVDLRRVFGMRVVGVSTIIAKQNASLLYRNDPVNGCPAAKVGLTLVTNANHGDKLCEGDVVGLVNLDNNVQAGACRLGPWTPFRKAR